MKRLRVYVSPTLMGEWGPEVAWIWRTMLTGLGWPWQLTDCDAGDCHIAYSPRHEVSPPARLRVHADAGRWRSLSNGPSGDCVSRLSQQILSAASDGWFALGDGAITCPYDFVSDCFALLTGSHERAWPVNRHGHFALPDSSDYRDALCLQLPVSTAFRKLESALARCDLSPSPFPRWPAGKGWAASASHDVDYPVIVRWLEAVRALARRKRAAPRLALDILRGRRHHWHFESWIALEEQLGIRSAFYFAARQGSLIQYALGTPDPFYDVTSPRFASLVRRIEAAGFEVGLQASYRAMEDLAMFAAEKRALEAVLGHEVHGNRHHYWRMDPDDPELTLCMHEKIGLAYDCSLALEHHLGWRRGSAWPFWPYLADQRRPAGTLQLGTAWMDDQVFGHSNFNAIASADDRAARLECLIEAAATAGGLLVADMHEYVFDEELFPGWLSTYERFWKTVRSRSDVWVATPAEIAAHWSQRAAAIQKVSTSFGAKDSP